MEYFRQYAMRIIVGMLSMILAASFVYMVCIPVYATQIGTIVQLAEHVYEKTDTGSNIVANVIMGYNFPILAEEADEGGNVWYLIETDMGVQGYIPAQNVVKAAANAPAANTQERDTQVQEPDAEEENENENNLPDSEKKQLLTMEVVNIRENPSTDEEVLGKIPRGTTLDYMDVVTNEVGEVWYEISYEDTHGFVKQSTVKEIVTPVQETDGTQPYMAGVTPENIDIDQMIETARQYQDEASAGESAAETDALEKTQAQENIVYDNELIAGEDAEETGKKWSIWKPDMVIILSLIGILLCAVVISQTFKKVIRLYR